MFNSTSRPILHARIYSQPKVNNERHAKLRTIFVQGRHMQPEQRAGEYRIIERSTDRTVASFSSLGDWWRIYSKIDLTTID